MVASQSRREDRGGGRVRSTEAARELPPERPILAPVAIDPARTALAITALHLLGDGATGATLEERFTGLGVRLAPGLGEQLLDDLRTLGLARVARQVDRGPFVVPTTLGNQLLAEDPTSRHTAALAEIESLRSELLATIAHELRTPLTTIRTSVGLLAVSDPAPTAEQRRLLLAAIERNAERMQRIIGDILDLARFRAGQVRLQLRRFDVGEVARAVIASVLPLAEVKGQRIVLRRGRDGPTFVFGDRRRLEQALLNLVSNAQRFSPEGAEIVIDLRQTGDRVRIAVVDRGPGIPLADRARLFERFFVGRRDRHGPQEGVGLGLPTALAIAQAHGGTIEVESEVGVGSTFTLVVPVEGPGEWE